MPRAKEAPRTGSMHQTRHRTGHLCHSDGGGGAPALHTVLVHDTRPRSGDTLAMARVIKALPFTDTGDTSAYSDDYGCQITVRLSSMLISLLA